MENKMERTNIYHQNRWVSLYQTPRTGFTPSFLSSGWESILPVTTQYRNPYLDSPANNRPTYYLDIVGILGKISQLVKLLRLATNLAFQTKFHTEIEQDHTEYYHISSNPLSAKQSST